MIGSIIFLILLLGGIFTIELWYARKNGLLTESNWCIVREIIFTNIESVKNEHVHNKDINEILNVLIGNIQREIMNNPQLSDLEKTYWTLQKIIIFVRPVLMKLLK